MECLLCLEYLQDESRCIPLNSTQFNIKSLIDKHLWPIETFTSTSWICSACLEELNDFHKFYTRIEESHYNNKINIKIDPLQEDSKPKEIRLTSLLEPEIIIGQNFDDTPIEIKTEPDKNSDDSLDIFGDDQHDSDSDEDDRDSDDNLLLIRKVVASKKTSLKNSFNVTEDEKSENGNDNVEEENPAAKKKRSPRTKNTNKSSNPQKINCVEYDKFLNEHFKMTCDKCQQTFERFRHLCQHYSKEHKEQGYALCCGTKFLKRQLLVDHVTFHLNPEYFKCEFCGKVFTKRVCLNGHVKIHNEKKFDCDMCGKKFVLKHKLDKHKLTHIPESERKFPCNECGKFYANENILTQHQKAVHLNIYAKVCEICGVTSTDTPTFKRHMEKHDPVISLNPLKCDECGLILNSQLTLKNHIALKHSVDGKCEYKCHICPKVSPNMRALKKHIWDAHELGYQFKCTVCEKEFKRADSLKAHMGMHTGKPLYRCPWCPKPFNSNGNMHQHRKKAHPIEWEEEQRRKYSGNLPPKYKPPSSSNSRYL